MAGTTAKNSAVLFDIMPARTTRAMADIDANFVGLIAMNGITNYVALTGALLIILLAVGWALFH